jgi:glycine/D-amino acid oxidase-like deaminating enzyme
MSTSLVPSKDALETESRSWAVKARGLQITDRESCLNASHLLRSIKTLRGQVQAWFAPHLDAAMETKRKAEAARKGLADEQARMEAPLIDAETVLKRSLLDYEAKEERERLAEEQRLQAEAQRRAEEVTLAAAAAMETEARQTGNVEMLAEAIDILEQPIEAPVVSVAKSVPKVQGVTYRDNWKAHPTVNVKALAAAVAAGKVPETFITVNMTAINQFARATHGAQPVPGVKFFNDRQIAARG